jgi:anti-sigma factor RsiW
MAILTENNADDAPVRLQRQLDLLVDDELSAERRGDLLQRMDRTPGGWRMVAMRFLQYQVERRAVREMIGVSTVNRGESEAPDHRRAGGLPQTLRIAAMVLATATLFSLAGLYIGGRLHTAHPAITTAFAPPAARLRSHFLLTPGSSAVPMSYPVMNGSRSDTTRNIVVVSDGTGRVVAFPVVPAVAVKTSPVY